MALLMVALPMAHRATCHMYMTQQRAMKPPLYMFVIFQSAQLLLLGTAIHAIK
jgi:hypothetical protein